jgi:hypothetical protein
VGDTPPETARRIPFDHVDGRIILPLRAGGSGEFGVILDMSVALGGVYLFHREAVGEIGVRDPEEVVLPNAGPGGAPSRGILADSVDLFCGDVALPRATVVVSTGDATQKMEWDGLIGFALFGSFAVEIDFDTRTILLHDPGTFAPDSAWARVPLDLSGGVPLLEVSLSGAGEAGRPAAVSIDLADATPFTFLVRESQEGSSPPVASEIRAAIVGAERRGDLPVAAGRISRLGIGPFVLRDAPMLFAKAEWRTSRTDVQGVLGSGALARFDAVFDYASGSLYLRPNGRFDEPFGP